ncbi:MAG: RteC domain-containing protein [Rikenellaceae bacterium]
MYVAALSLLNSEIELLKILISKGELQQKIQSPIQWSAKPVDLVELIYALYHSGAVGDPKLKDLFLFFGKIFNLNLQNHSHSFGRIRIRPGERCTFLYHILHNLNFVMEQKDR